MLKLKESNQDNVVRMRDMKHGDVGRFCDDRLPKYKGDIYMRFGEGNSLLYINLTTGDYGDTFGIGGGGNEIQILPKGTELTLVVE